MPRSAKAAAAADKPAAPAKAAAKKAAAKKAPADHPKYEEMIKVCPLIIFSRSKARAFCRCDRVCASRFVKKAVCLQFVRHKLTWNAFSHTPLNQTAIVALKERNGSSRHAIKKYIKANFNVGDGAQVDSQINRSIKSGVEKGVFAWPKGASGPVKLAKKEKEPSEKKEKKPTEKKEKKPAAEKKVCLFLFFSLLRNTHWSFCVHAYPSGLDMTFFFKLAYPTYDLFTLTSLRIIILHHFHMFSHSEGCSQEDRRKEGCPQESPCQEGRRRHQEEAREEARHCCPQEDHCTPQGSHGKEGSSSQSKEASCQEGYCKESLSALLLSCACSRAWYSWTTIVLLLVLLLANRERKGGAHCIGQLTRCATFTL